MRKLTGLLTALLFLIAQSAFAQNKTVKGKVTDARDGSALAGVSIKVKDGPSIGLTDVTGTFSVSVPAKTKSIVLSFVGFDETEVAITDGELSVKMNPGNRLLTEVVVTGYTSKSRRSNISSISTVAADDVRTQPIASFDQLLQGQAPGLNVKAGSGQPGRSADVVIRGKGSVNGLTTPLYIVDGIEVRASDFSTLNQGDFETISVLKDASSAGLYGSRGGNGVIVVTTKRGRAGKAKFSYDAQFGTTALPKNQLKLMNTQEKLDFELGIAGNPWGWTDEEVAELRKINTNWDDIVFQKGKLQSHQLSASGGNDKTTFYSSLALLDQEGVTLNTGLKRYTGRLNIAHSENRIKTGINLTGGWSEFKGTFEGDQSVGSALNTVIWALPYETSLDPDGKYTGSVQFPFWINPVEDLLENVNKSWQLKGTANAFVEYKLPWIKDLTFRINAGIDFSQFETFNIIKKGTQSALQNEAFGADFRRDGEVGRSYDRRFRYTITNSLSYRTFLDKKNNHSLNASVFTEFIKRNGRNFNYTGYGFANPFDSERGLVTGTAANGFIPRIGGGFPENSALNSYFGIADYSFKNRYFISLAGRADGSSRLSPENRWVYYGSVAAGWLVSDEDFFKVNAINFLKLKASYGAVGNDRIGDDFPYLQTYGTGTYAGQGSLQITRLGNDILSWEKRRTANIGVEFELFKSRIKGSVEYYNSLTKDLYFGPKVQATSGGNGNFLGNTGSMANNGIELNFSFKILNLRNFKWTLDANYSYNKNTIKSLPEGQTFIQTGLTALQVGKPFNSFFLVKYAGVNPDNGNSIYLKADGKTTTELYDANDLVVFGTSDAPHNGGITNTFSYKGIELSAFIVYSYGNYVYNNARFNVEFYQYTTSGFARNGLNAWTTPGQVTDFPRIDEATEANTTRFLEKGDFWRLRNVMLSYNLPKKALDKLRIQGLRIFLQGQNLYTNFDMQTWDPEVSNVTGGGSNTLVAGSQYPPLKTYSAGINLTF
jgi:TonB-dependent starch-binding outer membrane protein SusC